MYLEMGHPGGDELLAPAQVGRVEQVDGLQRHVGVGRLQGYPPQLDRKIGKSIDIDR